MPISLALIGDIFPMEERQQAIGTFMGNIIFRPRVKYGSRKGGSKGKGWLWL